MESSEIEKQMRAVVVGEMSSMEKLGDVTDWGLVKKVRHYFVSALVSRLLMRNYRSIIN